MGKFEGSWEDFIDKSFDLLVLDPCKSRIVIKYLHSKNRAFIKVTNDKKNYFFKLNTELDFKRLEEFIKICSKILSNVQDKEPEVMEMEEEQPKKDKKNKKKDKKKNK